MCFSIFSGQVDIWDSGIISTTWFKPSRHRSPWQHTSPLRSRSITWRHRETLLRQLRWCWPYQQVRPDPPASGRTSRSEGSCWVVDQEWCRSACVGQSNKNSFGDGYRSRESRNDGAYWTDIVLIEVKVAFEKLLLCAGCMSKTEVGCLFTWNGTCGSAHAEAVFVWLVKNSLPYACLAATLLKTLIGWLFSYEMLSARQFRDRVRAVSRVSDWIESKFSRSVIGLVAVPCRVMTAFVPRAFHCSIEKHWRTTNKVLRNYNKPAK